MAAYEADEAGIPDNGAAGGSHPRALQLLWGKRKLPCDTVLLEVSEILHLPYAESPRPKGKAEISEVFAYLELLREGAAFDDGHLELATEGCLKSRMRENRTSGSVRGSRQAFHVHRFFERSVETVYSTRQNEYEYRFLIGEDHASRRDRSGKMGGI